MEAEGRSGREEKEGGSRDEAAGGGIGSAESTKSEAGQAL